MNKNTKIISASDENVYKMTQRELNRGGVIVYPTETLYGIGAYATDPAAITEIFRIKERAYGKPMIVLVKDLEMLGAYCHVPDILKRNEIKYIDEPITCIFDQKVRLPEEVSAGSDKIGVRISTHPFVKGLFEFIDKPIVSTSANMSGDENIHSFQEVKRLFENKVDLIIDSGNLPLSNGSTVIDITSNPPLLLREGDIKKEELKEFLIGDY